MKSLKINAIIQLFKIIFDYPPPQKKVQTVKQERRIPECVISLEGENIITAL